MARAVLGRAVGEDDPVDAASAPDWLERPAPQADDAIVRALANRTDLGALNAADEALAKRRAAIRAEAIPSLEASAAWVWTSGSPYTEARWVEGAVVLNWAPFAAGTRGPRAAALNAHPFMNTVFAQ